MPCKNRIRVRPTRNKINPQEKNKRNWSRIHHAYPKKKLNQDTTKNWIRIRQKTDPEPTCLSKTNYGNRFQKDFGSQSGCLNLNFQKLDSDP